jgi:hypothetical protein
MEFHFIRLKVWYSTAARRIRPALLFNRLAD